MSKVSVQINKVYDLNEISKSVEFHFSQFDLYNKIKPEQKVLIKPNLLMKRTPEEFTTTHPYLVEAVIVELNKIGVKNIVVADSPGGMYTKQALKGIYDASGMTKVCEKYDNVELNFTTTFEDVHNENGKLVKSFPLITPVVNADFIIDVCKLKTHAMTGLSGGVKNLFGTIPGLTKPEFHWRFPEKEKFCNMLVDLCETVKPNFILVDAIHAMEGDGPSGGTKKECGLTIASDNPYELDLSLCHLIGVDSDKILTVKSSIERGLCCKTLEEIEFVGEELKPQNFEIPQDKTIDFVGHIPQPLKKISKVLIDKFFTSKPKIRTKECVGCGKCAESCPTKTISIIDRKAHIDYKNCISCFCCHEMCPIKVIDIKRSKLFKK